MKRVENFYKRVENVVEIGEIARNSVSKEF